MKIQQGTDKSSKHNGRTIFLRDFFLLKHTSTGVVSTSSYNLPTIHYTSSQYAPTYFFASASATDRVRHHQHSTPPTPTDYTTPLVWAGIQKHMIQRYVK